MFDLRYHVASLAAVFLALVIGILVGVGISSGGFVRGTERKFLNDKIAKLESQLDAAQVRTGDLTRLQRAADTFVEESYPLLMADLLKGKRIAVVYGGPVDAATRDLVQRTLSDTGAGGPVRMRAIRVPIDLPAVGRSLAGRPGLVRYAKQEAARDLGRRLAQELVVGGKTPVWRALSAQLLEERSGSDKGRADAIVVVRSVPPQKSPTARLLAGFYAGLAGAEVPAVGVETTHSSASAIDAFERAGLSSVDYVDTRVGRLALALLLAGAPGGNYGLKPSARDGILPPVTPLAETLATEA